jgi:hypothetical protein
MKALALLPIILFSVGLGAAQAAPPTAQPAGPEVAAPASTGGDTASVEVPAVEPQTQRHAQGGPVAEKPIALEGQPPLPLKPHHLAPGKGWSGSQFLQADKKGRLFLLRAATLDVFPLSEDGTLGEAKHLGDGGEQPPGECSVTGSVPQVSGQCFVANAAMSGSGDWVVQDGSAARIFRGTKEEPADKPRMFISGLAFQDDDPVIAGYPYAVDYALARHEEPPSSLALLSRWSSGKWEALTSSRVPPKEAALGLWERQMFLLAPTSDGHVWAGAYYQHRFREYSRAGKLLTEIRVGDGTVRRAPNAAARQKASDEIARELSQGKLRVSIVEMTGELVTLGLAEGRDGHMYFLVRDASDGAAGLYLERYDATSAQVERLPLSISQAGRSTLAAGKGGLFIAPARADEGIWTLSWDELREAKWQPIDEAQIGSGSGGAGPRTSAGR